MLKLKNNVSIYLYNNHVDFRKSTNGLLGIIIDEQIDDPKSGNAVIFYNKNRDKIKVVYWDRNGWVLYYKVLQENKFIVPRNQEAELTLTEEQLSWLLAGLDFHTMGQFPELGYCNYI